MRILLWHGWLLDGTGSNVYTAKVAEVWRRQGHEVVLVCQERHPDILRFVDGQAAADRSGVTPMTSLSAPPAPGSAIVIRPRIGSLLPVFVYDEYEGFDVRRFVDLADDDLEAYLQRNVDALRSVDRWRRADVVVAGHLVPGAAVCRRALGDGRYAVKVHGSDLEYAVRLQPRYGALAREGADAATAIVGASEDVLRRTIEVAPSAAGRTSVVPPGVEVDRWVPRERDRALRGLAERLERAAGAAGGRTAEADRRVRALLAARDGEGLSRLSSSYDQRVPDADVASRIRALARERGPIVGYLGKLIPEKGVERFLQALALLDPGVRGLVVGFGTFRDWLQGLVAGLDAGDARGVEWLGGASPMDLELSAAEIRDAAGLGRRVTFTGRLDHRYAPEAVAAMDVLVVPSTLGEAFGMVAAEAAAAGTAPLVARHSSLAEVAAALEAAADRPGLLSFQPGAGAVRRLAEGISRIVSLGPGERRELSAALRGHVVAQWTWERTAERLLAAAA